MYKLFIIELKFSSSLSLSLSLCASAHRDTHTPPHPTPPQAFTTEIRMRMNYILFLLPWMMLSTWSNGKRGSNNNLDDEEGMMRVSVWVNDTTPTAHVDADTFICATLDWWPPEKCDYGTCSWGHASILNLNLSSVLLQNAIKAFSPLKIRLGGTLQDQVVYHVGKKAEPCLPFKRDPSVMFGFSGGCLPMWRWNQLNQFFQRVGCQVAFGLNALFGRTRTKNSYSAWDPTNALDFIQYTHDKGYSISAWEFGNELSGSGVGTSLPPEQYAEDVKQMCKIVKQVYADQPSPPLMVAPDGFFDREWTRRFLQAMGDEHSLNVISHHIYNLGPGVDRNLTNKILDPSYLEGEAATFGAIKNILEQYGPWANSWVGEAGGAYNSGHHLVTDAFIMSFWYLDQLGMAATYGTKSYCRQSLVGGNYGLLNTTTFAPNPDYYSALLWHRLMGAKVLEVKVSGSPFVRAYAHCAKGTAGATVLLLNLNNQTYCTIDLSIQSVPFVPVRLEYHLTPKDDNIASQTMLLNGVPLEVSDRGGIPPLIPKLMTNDKPLLIKPLSIAFISLPLQLPTCL